jgi:hypothetical protein
MKLTMKSQSYYGLDELQLVHELVEAGQDFAINVPLIKSFLL